MACTSAETTRDNPQRILMGPPGSWGTGTVPDFHILDAKRSRTTSDAVDILQVRHASGGVSTVTFKAYEQRREKWQGESLHFVWFDEEPPHEIYSEGLTRTNATGGFTFITATPLLGMTQVVGLFYPEATHETRALVQMTLEDCRYEDGEGHYTDAQIEEIIGSYQEHEREARVKGIPMLGSGRVFPVAEKAISVDSFVTPEFWPKIAGIDFGWDHPTGAVLCSHDRENDVIYVVNAYKRAQLSPAQHAMTLRRWGSWIPWAWPQDGRQTESNGQHRAQLYREEGMRMIRDHATFEAGGYQVTDGTDEMLMRMQTGRLKVFSHLEEWFAEFRTYHRKNGKIVKTNDDLLDATRYAMMMRRFARVETPTSSLPKTTGSYDPLRSKKTGDGSWQEA